MADETPVQVLKEPGRKATTKSYMWVFRSGEFDKEQIVLFHYSETRSGQTAKEFLEGFAGYLMTDGYFLPPILRTAAAVSITIPLSGAARPL